MDKDPIDDLTHLPPGAREDIKRRRAERQAATQAKLDEYKQLFTFRGSAVGAYKDVNGMLDPKTTFVIRRYENEYGDTVYVRNTAWTNNIPPQDQLKSLSNTIKDQQKDFTALSSSEQTTIQTDFTAGGGADQRFGALLWNNLYASEFQRLK